MNQMFLSHEIFCTIEMIKIKCFYGLSENVYTFSTIVYTK